MISRLGVSGTRRIGDDWYDGTIPDNVITDASSHIDTAYSFVRFHSQMQPGLSLGRGAAIYKNTRFDVGACGRIEIGNFVMINDAEIICDDRIRIGAYSLISWNVVIMDSYRAPRSFADRRKYLRAFSADDNRAVNLASEANPIDIGENVWIGHDVVVLPGVSIGTGSVVGARSVVVDTIPEYCIAVGNPARIIRRLEKPSAGP